MKHKNFKLFKSNTENIINIKRSIQVNDRIREFIFSNSNYRRSVYNSFVAEYKRCNENNETFDPMKFKQEFYNLIEKPNEIYKTYTSGISEQVMKDIIIALKVCRTTNGTLRFKKFDRFKCSFKVHCKGHYRDIKNDIPRFLSKVHIISQDIISYSIRMNNLLPIVLNEPLWHDKIAIGNKEYYFDKKYKYAFSDEDIKEISFVHELGKFYIILSTRIVNLYNKKEEKCKRKSKAGIDLGVRNPIAIYDGDKFYIARMSNKELSRIKYLEFRAKKLQKILDKKKYGSNNYYKVLRKFRVTWYKIRNIRLNWRRKTAKSIVLRYDAICLDRFSTPDNKNIAYKPISRYYNTINRIHGMYDFAEVLIHNCFMYNTNLIKAPKGTTITCSFCDFKNQPIPLEQRKLVCSGCGKEIDRDMNAAINCYKYILE